MSENYMPPQPNNPTKEERYKLIKYALKENNRLEDLQNIIKLMSPPPDVTSVLPPGKCKGVKVAIIGAGEAGLSAAFELRKLGFNITVFEALENKIGGRVYTYYFTEDLYGELGPMRIPVSHEATWHYINLFNLDTRPFIQTNPNTYIYVQNTRVMNDGNEIMKYIYPKFKLTPIEGTIPFDEYLECIYSKRLLKIPKSVRKELLQIKKVYDPQIVYLDTLNVRNVCQLLGLSEGAINLIQSVASFDSAFFYYAFTELLKDEYAVNFSFLYEIVGGLIKLPLAFYKSLVNPYPKEYSIPNNLLGKIVFKQGTPVEGIYQEDKDKVILKYNNKYLNKPSFEKFDFVICAIPFSSLRNVDIYPGFSNRKMQAIREVNYATSQRTLFLCKKRFWEEGPPNKRIIGGGSYTDLPITTIWYPSDHGKCYDLNTFKRKYKKGCSPYEPGVLLASYNFNLDAIRLGNLDEERRFEEIKRQVELVHGLPKYYLDDIVIDYKSINWNDLQWFLGAVCFFQPEQKRVFSYAMTKPEYNLRVFFAGEHISVHHGWQQGALESGMKAAYDLAKVCKKVFYFK
ncbi:flavin monoamine oxidase family protein [Thermohalobacter berrensis]|uniref:Amine oxidase n=1 Tax=Thermohalobacter berrensis TaxID=99594 RepID=A0A419SVA9_9FIRM|nr:FAD-dependent oxidoreductase [Thermohalobacter berrensis]RKD29145.1 amine oxidase [Thermohalobacter berrensis]